MQNTGINTGTDFGFTDRSTDYEPSYWEFPPTHRCGCCCCKCDDGDPIEKFQANGDGESVASVDDGFVGDFDIVV